MKKIFEIQSKKACHYAVVSLDECLSIISAEAYFASVCYAKDFAKHMSRITLLMYAVLKDKEIVVVFDGGRAKGQREYRVKNSVRLAK